MRFYVLILTVLLLNIKIYAQDNEEPKKVTFNFGGFIKTSVLGTVYNNGNVDGGSVQRDFHLPILIPVGPQDQNYDLSFIAKESRFNFDVKTTLLGKEIHGFLEFDFLFSGQGKDNISNSYAPRLRHFYFEWDKFLIGQTWSSFMIVVIPDEIDFTGAGEGITLNRQAQIRFKHKGWWFALENPVTTVNYFNEAAITEVRGKLLPDIVVRRNFKGDWGNWNIAAMVRTLSNKDSVRNSTMGYGITTGGKIYTGSRGDDIRMVVTAGNGMGRYVGFGFIAGATQADDARLRSIPSISGYIAYNHFWVKEKLSSSFSVSAFNSFYSSEAAASVNKIAYSLSGNIKYDPLPVLRMGLEYMYGYRGLGNDVEGSFNRIQLAFQYTFGYHNAEADEKK